MTAGTPDGYVDAPVFLAIEPRRRGYAPPGFPRPVVEASVVAHTVKAPPQRKGVVVVKVTLRIPSAAFDPLRPEAVVVIPAELTNAQPVEVVAQEPTP